MEKGGGEKKVVTSLIGIKCVRITDKLTSATETGMKATKHVYICCVETCNMQCDYGIGYMAWVTSIRGIKGQIMFIGR